MLSGAGGGAALVYVSRSRIAASLMASGVRSAARRGGDSWNSSNAPKKQSSVPPPYVGMRNTCVCGMRRPRAYALVFGKIVPPGLVPLGDHQAVTLRERVGVEESQAQVVLVHHVCRFASGHDVAEDAVGGSLDHHDRAHEQIESVVCSIAHDGLHFVAGCHQRTLPAVLTRRRIGHGRPVQDHPQAGGEALLCL